MMRAVLLLILAITCANAARAETLCTLVTDARTGAVVIEEGACAMRVTPASTFKVPLAVMGFDSGVLSSPDAPALSPRPGDPDWGGAPWRAEADPAHWMAHSVVWYSRRIAEALGAERLSGHALAYGFGNGDFSGDRGEDNGLDRAWIASSLLVSPKEQAAFLHALLGRALPASAEAHAHTVSIITRHPQAEGWTLAGKTGSAYPRRADTSFDRDHGWGWYAGWAEQDGAPRYIVVRLAQAAGAGLPSGGQHVRDTVFADWPAIAARLAGGGAQ
ncbi:class D beta-lactamase [Pelagibacterium montanilacus]|uniref:class D beta-lactamase n=1 Tax=Pelagibacterium montanilacus TaxID=2185280 RepID=UPI000F8F64D9|nr:class D beta-lactamase [Pelagibacterium montanilacus]